MDYNQLLQNFSSGNGFNLNQAVNQKTPAQLAEEQKVQAYQMFIQSKDGVEALSELNSKFDAWYNNSYGTKQSIQSEDVKDLRETVARMEKMIEGLTNQLK